MREAHFHGGPWTGERATVEDASSESVLLVPGEWDGRYVEDMSSDSRHPCFDWEVEG